MFTSEHFVSFLSYLYLEVPSLFVAVMSMVLRNLQSLTKPLIEALSILAEQPPSSWNAMSILPPIITLFAAYLTVYGFHRVARWGMHTAFFKRSLIFAVLGISIAYLGTDSSCRDDIAQVGFASSMASTMQCALRPEFWDLRSHSQKVGAVIGQFGWIQEQDTTRDTGDDVQEAISDIFGTVESVMVESWKAVNGRGVVNGRGAVNGRRGNR